MTICTHETSHEPSQFLAQHINLLPKGRALDVAMGSGRNAIYLAKMGFQVEGVDVATQAVSEALKFAEKEGVEITAQVADLEMDYRIRQNAYEVIICFNYLQRSLIPQMKDGLCKGGMVVYETFIVDHGRFRKPRNRAHLLKHNELLDMFREFRCLRYREGIIGPQRAIASIIAEKV